MSNILLISDGSIGFELEIAVGRFRKIHQITSYRIPWRTSPRDANPLDYLPNFLQDNGDTVDLIIEAIVSDTRLKRSAIEIITTTLFPERPLLSSTLNASATQVSSWVPASLYAWEVVGWATISPLDKMKTIEIIQGVYSHPKTIQKVREFFASLGKEPVIIKDCVGGVLPRVVASLINNATYALMEGVASAADIDAAMKLGTNYPYGPLEWADLIGLDHVLGILESLCEAYGQDRYRPAPLLRQLVSAGYFGKSAEHGFYEYY